MKESLSNMPLNLERLSDLFHAELTNFRAGMRTELIPKIQDLRAGALGWIARFLPEAVREADRDLISETRAAVRGRPDFATGGWYRIPYLDAAQYALSGDRSVLDVLIANLDHATSALRSALHAPLGLVVDRLSIEDEDLVRRISGSLAKGHLDNESLLCLFITARGKPARKFELARHWRDSLKLAPQDIPRLDAVLTAGFLSNAHIYDEYSEILRYLFCRMLEAESPQHNLDSQLEFEGVLPRNLPRVRSRQIEIPGIQTPKSVRLDVLWQRMSEHPLMRADVQSRLNNLTEQSGSTKGNAQ